MSISRLARAVCLAAVILPTATFAQDAPLINPAKSNAPNVADPVSYVIGFSVGRTLAGDGFQAADVRGPDFLEGVIDSLSGKQPRLSDEQLRAVSQQIDAVLTKRAQEAERAEMEKQAAVREQMKSFVGPNLEKSKKFHLDNAKKDGVKTLPSGLQYAVITAGTGAKPTAKDVVVVNYEGKTIDGKVFDSTKGRQPAKFPVGAVVKGWVEGLQLMSVGDKWTLYLPPDLAYGENGVPQLGPDGKPVIGPNETLIFEVELLDILPGQ